MIQLKPSNIFDFYAPTGGLSKIADFSLLQKKMSAESKSVPFTRSIGGMYKVQAPLNSPPPSANSASDNTCTCVLIGLVIAVVVIHYLVESSNEEDKEK